MVVYRTSIRPGKRSWKKGRLGLNEFATVTAEKRRIQVGVDEEYLAEVAELDGCYAIKTDLPAKAADTETVQVRYKNLARVYRAAGMASRSW
ncbi:MAG: hypothetical protein AB1641_04265 [Thermodesulfobacteriota bacterium]